MIITYGSSTERLARRTAEIGNLRVVEINRRLFPDGEQYLRLLGDVEGEDVAVFQSLGLNPDRSFMEYALLVDALKGAGCRSVTGVVPYLAYARQDRRFNKGEPLSAKIIAKLIESAGTDRIITIDMHLHRFRDINEVFDIPATNLTAMNLLAEYYANSHDACNSVVVGPDGESEQWAKIVADKLSARCHVLEKERLGDREVQISDTASIQGARAVLVDDMISTGKTMIEVIIRLKAQGVRHVDALVTHSLMVDDAYPKLRGAGLSELISTDTVEGPQSLVSVAPVLAKALKH
ncbi:MAG: ribose-phosphate diphosphokinase [Candidatus Methanomethylicus sp.]|nr:ribose-phosphate diphosphokinase [Candidatus Methanomethylicus sp.]